MSKWVRKYYVPKTEAEYREIEALSPFEILEVARECAQITPRVNENASKAFALELCGHAAAKAICLNDADNMIKAQEFGFSLLDGCILKRINQSHAVNALYPSSRLHSAFDAIAHIELAGNPRRPAEKSDILIGAQHQITSVFKNLHVLLFEYR